MAILTLYLYFEDDLATISVCDDWNKIKLENDGKIKLFLEDIIIDPLIIDEAECRLIINERSQNWTMKFTEDYKDEIIKIIEGFILKFRTKVGNQTNLILCGKSRNKQNIINKFYFDEKDKLIIKEEALIQKYLLKSRTDGMISKMLI